MSGEAVGLRIRNSSEDKEGAGWEEFSGEVSEVENY